MISLTWIISIVSVLGIAGTIAALIFIPAVAVPILQSVVSAILRCKPCLYAIAIITACWASWWFGYHQAVLACRAEELAAELRNQQVDLAIAKQSAADESRRATTIEATANDQRSKDADYIAKLEKRPGCALDDGDLGRVPNNKPRPGRAKPPVSAR